MKSVAVAAAALATGASAHYHYAKVAAWQRIRREGPCDPAFEPCAAMDNKFVEELRKPPTAKAELRTDPVTGVTSQFHRIPMVAADVSLHPLLPKTRMFTYDGVFPGPTIEVESGTPVFAEFPNHLPGTHILPIDKSVCGGADPGGRAVVHLHGGHQGWASDGNAFAWYGPNGTGGVGPDWRSPVSYYPNDRPAGLLWYHDHAACITRLNVYAGLVGLYVIRDTALETSLGLPSGDFEMPLVMMDRALNADGSLQYPGDDPDDSIVPEFFGNISVVNGQAWPRMSVFPARYRFRLLGGGNSRFWNIRLYNVDADTNEPNMNEPGPGFTVIGTEGGLLHRAVPVPDWMLVAPAERYDIIIDFSSSPVGTVYSLVNNGGTPYSGPGEESGDEVPLPEVMRFQVVDWDADHPASSAPAPLPAVLAPAHPHPHPKPHAKTWRIDMSEYEDDIGRLMLLLENSHCEDAIKTKPEYGEVSYFEFINTTPDYHPMHVHLVSFSIDSLRPFDVDAWVASGGANLTYTGPKEKPVPWQQGFKDTVAVPVGYAVKVKALFDRPGNFMFHCHILEHEDYDMMRFYQVVPRDDQLAADPALAADWAAAQAVLARLDAPIGAHSHSHRRAHRVYKGNRVDEHTGKVLGPALSAIGHNTGVVGAMAHKMHQKGAHHAA